ncbi:hypothetical protein J3S90_15455 [Flavobacterium sp. P4023]|uniref:DUF4178 domain-containing protein n=1 Tax=Flavobacterium flabelliforme TaxID=2816119 RepID=A0ABS5CX78_9FLAO|nr:hypothetical protein [Flavobacterium flabelliforme]MBP4143201.1 hypothetical protein [Flavobacterium flabelliforme]
MNQKLTIIFSSIVILIIALYFGLPFEFFNINLDRIANIIAILIVLFVFYKLLKLSKTLSGKVSKLTTRIILFIVFALYLLNGIWTVFFVTSNYYPIWQDLKIYTNSNNEKVVSEWRETSGSLYDYRYRKIYFENKIFRFSINYDKKKMSGNWNVYDVREKTKTKQNLN